MDSFATDPSEDVDWVTYVEVVVVPAARLSVSQKRVIELDYGMRDGRLALQVREALLFYYLEHLGLLPVRENSAPTEQIALENQKDLEPFFSKHGLKAQ